MSKRVLSVGNCRPDHRAISSMIESRFSAVVKPVDDLPDALEHLRAETYDLVLVNRVLDSDGSDGLEVIRQIKAAPDLQQIPVMMITNFAEHQQQAQQAGALPGFGKQTLRSPETTSLLAPLLS